MKRQIYPGIELKIGRLDVSEKLILFLPEDETKRRSRPEVQREFAGEELCWSCAVKMRRSMQGQKDFIQGWTHNTSRHIRREYEHRMSLDCCGQTPSIQIRSS